MKRLSIILSTILILIACAKKTQDNNTYTINGTVENDTLNDKYVYLFASLDKMDSAIAYSKIENNKFKISNSILVRPFTAPLVVGDSNGNILRPYIGSTIVMEAGNIDVVIKESTSTKISGTPLNDMFYQCEATTIKYDSICFQIANSKYDRKTKMRMLDSLKTYRANTIYNALINNINYRVTNEVINLTYLYMFSHQLTDIAERTHKGAENENIFNLIEHAAKTSRGKKYNNLTLNDTKDKQVSINNYIGKTEYTLIVHWASWCGPCLRLIPKIKHLGEISPENTFNVIAISLDNNKENWLKAVDRINTDWIHLSTLKAWKCPSATEYGINFIPASILIDKHGTIVARNPSPEELKIFFSK